MRQRAWQTKFFPKRTTASRCAGQLSAPVCALRQYDSGHRHWLAWRKKSLQKQKMIQPPVKRTPTSRWAAVQLIPRRGRGLGLKSLASAKRVQKTKMSGSGWNHSDSQCRQPAASRLIDSIWSCWLKLKFEISSVAQGTIRSCPQYV